MNQTFVEKNSCLVKVMSVKCHHALTFHESDAKRFFRHGGKLVGWEWVRGVGVGDDGDAEAGRHTRTTILPTCQLADLPKSEFA